MVSASSTAACMLLVSRDVAFCSAVSAKYRHMEEAVAARGTGEQIDLTCTLCSWAREESKHNRGRLKWRCISKEIKSSF